MKIESRALPRLGIFFSHPTQHHSVMFKHLSEVPDISTHIYYYDYGSLKGAFDPGYGTSESWDVDLLSGTPTKVLPNLLRGQQISQFRQFNPRVIGAMLRERFDAVFVSGYVSPSNWLVLLGAKLLGAKVFYQSDTNILDEERKPQSRLKAVLRRAFLDRVDLFLPIGDHNREVYTRLGYDPQNMVWCPCPVDVERFRGSLDNAQTKTVSEGLRAKYDIPDGAKIVAFCGKLIERKRPQDLIDAVRSLGRSDVYALLIGSGPMEAQLRAGLSPADPVRITGFVNQSQMPAHMMLADVGVVCSEWDPHPLVVTEFAACGLPVVASHFCGMWGPNDILRPDENGFVYPCGDVAELACCITRLVDDPALAARMGAHSLELSATQSARYGAQIVAEQLRKLRRSIAVSHSNTSSRVALVPLKRAIAAVLCSAPMGWFVGTLFANRVPHRGASIDTHHKAVKSTVKAALLWGIYESAETRFLQKYLEPTRDVVELGASLGVVTSHIARIVGTKHQIVVVEANPALLDSIQTNVRRNCSGARLSVVHGAIFYSPAHEPPPASIHLQLGNTNTDSSVGGGPTDSSVAVPVVTLSQILEAHAIGGYTLVCDIEGAEVGLLEREQAALSRCELLIAELHATQWEGQSVSADELCDRFQREHGFRLRDRHGPVCVFDRPKVSV